MGSSKNFWNNFEAQAGKQSTLWLQWGISTWELVLCAARTRFPETQICCSCLVQDSGSKVRLLARAEKSWELMVVRKSSSPGEHFSPPLSHSPSPGVFYLIYDLPAAVWRGFSCFFYPLWGLICNPFLWPACGLGLPWLFSTQPPGLPFNFIPDTKHLTSFSQGIALLSPTHLFKT